MVLGGSVACKPACVSDMNDEVPPAQRAVDPDAAQRLREMFATWPVPPYRRPAILLAALLAVAALLAASMPLPWFHHDIPGRGFSVVYGYSGASWLVVVALLMVAVAVRVALRPPTGYVTFVLLVIALLTLLGMYAEWADNYTQAGQLNLPAFVGPGFYVAVAGTGCIIMATVLAWRRAR